MRGKKPLAVGFLVTVYFHGTVAFWCIQSKTSCAYPPWKKRHPDDNFLRRVCKSQTATTGGLCRAFSFACPCLQSIILNSGRLRIHKIQD